MVFSALCLISVLVNFIKSDGPLFISAITSIRLQADYSLTTEEEGYVFTYQYVCLSVCPLDYSKMDFDEIFCWGGK